MDTIRTFIALELPTTVRSQLEEWARKLLPFWPEGALRWVKADNLHLTLRFLGDTQYGSVPELVSGIDGIARQQTAFDVVLSQLGGFPSLRRGQAIWVGVGEGEDDQVLAPLQKEVERLARRLGWQRQRQAFRPHITLARVRGRGQRGRFGEDRPPEVPGQRFQMTGMTLFHSNLTPAGAEYHALHRAEFGGVCNTQ